MPSPTGDQPIGAAREEIPCPEAGGARVKAPQDPDTDRE